MWIGKLAIILYAFSFLCLVMGVMFQYGLSLQWSIFKGWTAAALNDMIGSEEMPIDSSDLTTNAVMMVFGDWFVVAKSLGTLLFNGVSGGIVQDMFSQLPFWNEYTMLIVRFLYTFSSFILVGHIISGRMQ